jgi:hypothetical protein
MGKKMKIAGSIMLLVFLTCCLSTKQAAKYRNADFRDYNYYEKTRFWRSIDIARFTHNLTTVRFAVAAEQHTIDEMLNQSYLRSIKDSLARTIESRNKDFQSLKISYFDTTAPARRQIFTNLKSDSPDRLILAAYRDSPYHDLLEDLFNRYRTAIENSRFYQSQSQFEAYLQTRSFTVVDSLVLKTIFKDRKVEREELKKEEAGQLKDQPIDFLILFNVSYSSDYSEEAGARVGAEHVDLACFSIAEDKIISEAARIYFLDNGSGSSEDQ